MNEITFVCPEAYVVLKDAVAAGLKFVREHEARGSYVSEYYNFPEMDYFDSGLPRFSKTIWGSGQTPKDYKSVFQGDWKPDLILEWRPYYELARRDERLRRYYDESAKYREEFLNSEFGRQLMEDDLTFSIGYTIEELVNRYIHTTKSKEFDESRFLPIYREWETAVFQKEVVFDILVPLLMVTCNFDTLELGDGLAIERLEEGVQLARSGYKRFLVSANDSVEGAATHALVLRHWTISNVPKFLRSSALTNVEQFHDVIVSVDLYFAALRAASGVQTGYSQLLIRPDGWGDSWLAHLPQVDVIALRKYPDHFENYWWLRKPPVLGEETCRAAGKLYEAIIRHKKNEMLVAAKRLNSAYLRSSEEDSIIDVAIGLETLLVSDGRQGEITHKLAMRLGAVCKMKKFESHEASDVFEICKKIYDFRSAVAHGSENVSKKRTIAIRASKEPVEAIALGIALLRHVLIFLADNPEFLSPKKLDMTLFSSETPAPSS